MRKLLLTAAALSVSFYASSSYAQVAMLEACSAEVADFCEEVQPGEGRLAACLYAHTDLLGDECFAATAVSSVILERLFDRIQVVAESCEADIAELCGDEPAGAGRVYACLRDNKSNLSASCEGSLPAGD
ncbi:MAG: cysteine rich repeat-containing protein [Pseudomonadota bacterium]